MLPAVRTFAEICAQTLPITDPVVEFGSFQVADEGVASDLRPVFGGHEFLGTDVRAGPGVDIVMDLHHLDLADGSVGTALIFDTLEHVKHPWTAISELHRVLQPNGLLILSVPFRFPVHSYPNDYWRFTPQGVAALLEDFPTVIINEVGVEGDPTSVLAVASKSALAASEFEPFTQRMRVQTRHWQQIVAAMGSGA